MSEDLIKRSDAIKAIWGEDTNPSEDGAVFEAQSHIDRDIRLIPSEDRPQGEWIYCEEDDSHLPEDGRYGIFKCSNCGSEQSFPISEGSGRVYADNYCPTCGARMKGADDEDN